MSSPSAGSSDAAREDDLPIALAASASGIGFWDWHLATNTVFLSREWQAQLGYADREIPGRQEEWERRLHPDDAEPTLNRLRAHLADPRTPYEAEFRLRHKNGSYRWILARGEAIRDYLGVPLRVVGCHIDVTEQKQTETRLKWLLEGESLLSRLSQRFIDMNLAEFDARISEVLRSVGEFVSVVRVALFIYSGDGKRVLNTHEWSVDPTDSLVGTERDIKVGHYAFFHRELAANRVVRVETIDDLPGDSEEHRYGTTIGFRSVLLYPLMSRSRLIGVVGFFGPFGESRTFDSDVQSFLASFAVSLANVVSRKTAEEERLSLERQLLQAQKMEAIGTLSGGIAHDFNNVLGAIIGNVGLARMESELGRSVDDSLLEIERAAERAGALVQQILAFSRQQEHQRRVIALAPVVEDAVRLLRASIPATVSIQTSFGRNVPNVEADQTQMHQILLNLCANAWHAMEEAPGIIHVGLEAVSLTATAAERIGGIKRGRFASLTVRDNGRGMDEATLKRIFDPFFTTKTVGKGTGLGMSVVHGIVRSHHGGISLVSEAGRGTSVTVYLPAATTPAREVLEEPPVVRGHGERILIVDDEEAIVRVKSRILEGLGYRVTGFLAPREALEAFRREPDAFDLVMTDYEMPEITGIAVAREVSRLKPGTPIVLCSGRFREDAREEAEAAGIRRFVTKPCGASVLSRVVGDLLAAASGR